LILELTGHRSDLLLVDAEGRIQLSLNRGRERTGQRYAPPPAPPEGYWTEGYRKSEAFPIVTPDQPSRSSPFPVSAMIEARYQAQEADLARERLRQARLVGLRKAIKRHRKRIESLRADLAKADRYREYGRYGELLKATLSAVQKGQDRVTVVDYFDLALPELVIPLDPAKTPQVNMEDYFKKHRKQLTAEREIRPRLAATEQELERLQQELQAVQQPDWTPPPTIGVRPHARSGGQAAVRAATRPKGRSGPFRKFVSEDGTPIYVGRNAKENEELTFKVARSDDLWLHARGTPGSHVIVRLEKGTDPSPETLKDAATLAIQYSDFRKSGKGEVLYTRRKWVRKAKGQPPGTVTVTQEKTLFVQLERTRLARLKTSG
ncbi:MAG: NFACT RNA binding domain-containing protein, partial [Nitrospirales bacterium]